MSEKKLSVLYLTDNNYAAYAGVSIVSLFENNKHLDGIKVYVIDDNISDDNKAKMQEAAQNYGREIIFLDVSSGIKKLEAIGAPKYRDSYTTYLKLFAFGMLPDEDERVFFIDSDSVVVGKADEILEVDLKGNAIAAVKETLYVPALIEDDGIVNGAPYFNMGVMVVDIKEWKKRNYEQAVLDQLKIRTSYFAVDQDILNTIAKSHITPIHPRYNCTAHINDYSYRGTLKVFPQADYYTEEEFDFAKKNPVIHHFERYVGQQPWIKGNVHPYRKEYEHYLSLSPWKGLPQIKRKYGLVFKIEILLYRLLPHAWFLRIYAKAFKRYANNVNKALKQGSVKSIH